MCMIFNLQSVTMCNLSLLKVVKKVAKKFAKKLLKKSLKESLKKLLKKSLKDKKNHKHGTCEPLYKSPPSGVQICPGLMANEIQIPQI